MPVERYYQGTTGNIKSNAATSIGMAFATAICCQLGIAPFYQGFWSISPIWPAAGVAVVAFRFFGARAWLPVMAGYCWLWVHLPPGTTPWVWIAPPFYTAAGWLISWVRRQFLVKWTGKLPGEMREFLADFVAPMLVLIPFASIIAAFVTQSWSFGGILPVGEKSSGMFARIWMLIFLAHYLGVLTFSPFLAVLIRRQGNAFFFRLEWRSMLPLMLCLAGFFLMTLLFTKVAEDGISSRAALFLPLPFFVIAAIWLNRQQATLVALIWCSTTLILTGSLIGPFGKDAGIASSHFEFGIYNLLFVFMIRGISITSSSHINRLQQNRLLLKTAEVLAWRWSRETGLDFSQNDFQLIENQNGATLHELANLEKGRPLSDIPDQWKCRLVFPDSGRPDRLFQSVGNVLFRNLQGEPEEIVGLLRDVTSELKAEEAYLLVETQNARLRGLTAQLNPHFLFNSLNIIRALVHSDAQKAESVVLNLAHLLRQTLRNTKAAMIPIEAELKHVEALLAIAKVRFEERLDYRIEIGQVGDEFHVPSMMVLNLVENAITHGIARLPEGGVIEIQIRPNCENNSIAITILNSGHLDPGHHTGIGLSDARQRLDLLYGAAASLELTQLNEQMVVCRLEFPNHSHEVSHH